MDDSELAALIRAACAQGARKYWQGGPRFVGRSDPPDPGWHPAASLLAAYLTRRPQLAWRWQARGVLDHLCACRECAELALACAEFLDAAEDWPK